MSITVSLTRETVDRVPDMPERPVFTTPWRVYPQASIDEQHERYGPDAYVIHAARLDESGRIFYLYTNGDVRCL